MPPLLEPWDEANARLQARVHPLDWPTISPAPRYNLVVLGAGTAGLVAAAGAAGLGAKVALVERHLMGGDCLNYGCVPSKVLLAAAHRRAAAWREHRSADDDEPFGAAFAQTLARMREIRADLSRHDSAERFRQLGVDVFLGHGHFFDDRTVQVGDQMLRFERALIATGARAAPAPWAPLANVTFHTNETIFSWTQLPRSVVMVGGGPMGVELAQALARFGAHVTLVCRSDRILSHDDPAAVAILHQQLERDGVRIVCRAQVEKVSSDAGQKWVHFRSADGTNLSPVTCDEIVCALGRSPNLDGLHLEKAGIAYDTSQGIRVNDRLCTTNRRVFAAGDVCSSKQFTHAADFQARLVVQNALFGGRARASRLVIPHCTYTDPEVAQVGPTEQQARAEGIALDIYTQTFAETDRAVLEDQTEGFVRIYCAQGTDRIVGATIVGPHAGDLLSPLTLAIQKRLGLATLAATIQPYPTRADAIRRLGDQYRRTQLTPWLRLWLQRWFAWRRRK